MTALSREALCFPRRHEWCLEEVRSPPVSWQKSCSLASAWRRLLLSGSEYPFRSPAGALLRSPIKITLSLGYFSTHAVMISDRPDLLLLYRVSSRELVQVDNDKFATTLSRCREGQRSSAHHWMETLCTSHLPSWLKYFGCG